MDFEQMIQNNKMKGFNKKHYIANYNEKGNLKSIPAFKCEVQKNRDKEDSRVKINKENFPFFHQVTQFEMQKNVSSETLRQELIIAKDEGYYFPNGTFVKLIHKIHFT